MLDILKLFLALYGQDRGVLPQEMLASLQSNQEMDSREQAALCYRALLPFPQAQMRCKCCHSRKQKVSETFVWTETE